jgi:ribonucleotide reductase alpha subunit
MSNVIHGITVDFSRDSLFDELGLRRLKESYFMAGETSPQERFAYVASKFGSNPEHAQRLYNYASKHWLSFSTPILSYGRNKRGLPISCYLNYLDDSSSGLVNNLSETNWLSMMGGGVGIHMGIRGADDKSVGIMPHLKVYDSSSLAFKQGTTRRGSYAAYLDIDHPDIIQFMEMRKPTGDQNMRTLNMNHGINISDKFMTLIEKCMMDKDADDTWELIQPNTGRVAGTVSAKELWIRILETRMTTGEPYLWFIDTANAGLPDYQRAEGLKIHGSNLCLTGETLIEIVDTGSVNSAPVKVKLKTFVENYTKYNNPVVRSFDGDKITWGHVTAAAQTTVVDELYVITTRDGKVIRCTGNHKIYTKNRGYVEAQYLTPEDDLFEYNSKLSEELYKENSVVKVSVAKTPVYDITVDTTECFFANDILVHNCSEISLATSKERTAVCCLSSVNLEHYDDWKNHPHFIGDVLEMLDNVLTVFIADAPDEISRARYSAQQERSVGVGVLGFHALLQKNNYAFEGVMAKSLNNRIFKHIREQLDKKNHELAVERGACPDAAKYGKMIRNSHTMAIAPTASSSIIMGNTSPSVEPYSANIYRQDTTSGAYININRFLDKILREESKKRRDGWYEDTIASITANNGSVQHLEWMDENTKFVFKTAPEIDQRWVIEHASDRQQYIDQAQSVNLFFAPDVNVKYLHAVHFMAWKNGLKGLYYCRSSKFRKADKVGQRIERKKIEEEINLQNLVDGTECLACQ